MKFFVFTGALVLTLSGCAQFTTSDAELDNMKQVADTRADNYVECMKTEASSITSSTDYAFIAQAVGARCKTSLDEFKVAQKEYLASQYMMTRKPLDASVQELEQRAQTEVAELLIAREEERAAAPVVLAVPAGAAAGAAAAAGTTGTAGTAGAGAATAPAATGTSATAAAPTADTAARLNLSGSSVAAASAAAVGVATTWNPEQRVYLDCMDEQADKYGRLNESAEAIAVVAADRCRSYLTVERRQQLEEQGKVQVMGKVMDKRLSGGR